MDSRVKDVMTTDVVSVRETAEYKDIVAVLRELHVSGFPVLNEADHLVGVVSEADLLLKEAGQEALGGYLSSSAPPGRTSQGRRTDRCRADVHSRGAALPSMRLSMAYPSSCGGNAYHSVRGPPAGPWRRRRSLSW